MHDIADQLIKAGMVTYEHLNTLRIKMHVPCQWTCNFCHMEGSFISTPIHNNTELQKALFQFREKFGFNEIHFTGGEPTIHPELIDMIKLANQLGFTTKITTNGYTDPEHYFRCIEAGLDEINVSVHTLSGIKLSKIMRPVREESWGEEAVAK
ncbi:MAG: radical SAM protein [Pseudomonadota bacterium]